MTSTNPPLVSQSDQYTNKFPVKVFTSLLWHLTHAELTQLRLEVLHNLALVHSDIPTGTTLYMAIIQNDVDFKHSKIEDYAEPIRYNLSVRYFPHSYHSTLSTKTS